MGGHLVSAHAGGGYHAVVDHNDPLVKMIHQALFVGHHHHGGAQGVDALQQGHDLQGAGGVQVAGGLVGHDGAGIVHQGPGDGHSLLLAAGQLIREPAALAVQPHQAQHIGDAAFDLPGGGPHRPHGQAQIVVHGFVADQAEILEDHPHGAAHQGNLTPGDVAHGEAVDHHPAPGGHQLAGQQLDDGGLSAAGGAHQEHEFSVLNLKRNAI